MLKIPFDDLEPVARDVDLLLTKHLDGAAKIAVKKWRTKVAGWHAQSKDLFRYLRNAPPSRSCVTQVDGHILSDPNEVNMELLCACGQLESWTNGGYEYAMHMLEDHFSLFLPRMEMQCVMNGDILCDYVKVLRKTAPGVDGWTQPELRALPREAWHSLLDCIRNPAGDLAHSLSYIFKRIPLEKGQKDLPCATDLRPIDIYSMIWRLVAAAQCAMLRTWKAAVLHPTQFASRGGTLEALSRVGATCEGIFWGTSRKFGFSVDFPKLFNMIDVRVAMRASILMGLRPEDAILLADPLCRARGCGRCPWETCLPCLQRSEGSPRA